ncbi:hypothetical protein ACI3EY_07880 [Ornithinimicrobium sp. LYQ92]|uniref:hypothetical protein n=1 Tax=Serinicoccus sp. LYQ92 TaxID=3378798 RepID=UPI00385429E5
MSTLASLFGAVPVAIFTAFLAACAYVLWAGVTTRHPKQGTPPRPEQPGDISRLDRLSGIRPADPQQWVPRNVDEAGIWWDDLIARGDH